MMLLTSVIICVLTLVYYLTSEEPFQKEILFLSIPFFVLLISILTFCSVKHLVKPLKNLTDMAQRIVDGDDRVQIRLEGSDEIYRLSAALKKMVDYLLKNKAQHSMLLESLDQQVRARTREIEATNLELEKEIAEKNRTQTSLNLAAQVIENTQEAVMITDKEARIIDINRAFTEITGYFAEEVREQKPGILQSGKQNKKFYQDLWTSLLESGKWQGEMWNRRKNGSLYPAWNSINAVYDIKGDITNFVSMHTDITEIKDTQKRMEQLANYDLLTGLPNKTLLRDRIKQSILISNRNRKKTAIIMIDLDGFKEINDAFGHETGDELLVKVGQRLRNCLRTSDTVARLGGDEFVVVLPSINSMDNLIWLSQDILDELNKTFMLKGSKCFVTASLGISMYPDDGQCGDTVMKNADAAMYAAKEAGKNTFRFFTESMLEKSKFKLFKAGEIREALGKREFILHFQPRYVTKTRKIHGMEALIRWYHPKKGLIYPGDFIPLAEETGLITNIDAWVLKEACLKNKQFGQIYGKNLIVSVNLSAKDFMQDNLVDIVKSTIETSGIEPSSLEIEITETVLMDDVDKSIKTLKKLKETGIILSVDDFGTGYSSLSYLKLFPIDILKIDRSFITDLPLDRDDRAVVEAIIAMSHALGITVLAEGVETEAQFDFLAERGCEFIQGFYLSKPVAADEFMQKLEVY